jgi:5-methylcytosine-specific restriction enzyme B
MADYFTSDHFKLLNKWKGQKRDETNPEQNRAYEELRKAYEVTEAWARALQQRVFPMGRVEIRRRPTSQGNTFLPYNWAKIYPSDDAPKELAYTVGIGTGEGFVVKIDTVSLGDGDRVRREYERLRGAYDNRSPLLRMLSVEEGLSKSMQELVTWSADAIGKFGFGYEELVQKLGLDAQIKDDEVLLHFDSKPSFKVFRLGWTNLDRELFCRLARAAHKAGLDWWHEGDGVNVRFGRKNPGTGRALAVLGTVHGTRIRTLSLRRKLGSLARLDREPLTAELVSKIEADLIAERGVLDHELGIEVERPGLWPDELQEEEPDPSSNTGPGVDAPRGATRLPINRIYYGPPGTGKTYELTQLLKRDYEKATTAISAEEWRNQFIADKVATLKWWEVCVVALQDLGGKAKVAQLYDHPFTHAVAAAKGRTQNIRQTLWGTLQHHTVEESNTVNMKLRMSPAIFDKTSDSVWHFAGDWREECADLLALVDQYRKGPTPAGVVQRYTFVTFHQSYGYEEFVEGLRPVLQGDGEASEVRYEIRPGVLKRLCDRARLSKDQHFAIVIDEINRGNISKIFGELITLIEVDKREGEKNAVAVTLPYSGEPFSVPSNVDIIGTMNTADRSLALLDTALRRRFEFVPVLPDSRDVTGAPLHGLRVTIGETAIDVPRLLAAINQRIEALYDRDHMIGHAYFTPLRDVPDGEVRMAKLVDIFSNRVIPLLEEYFFEDWQKIRFVLADNQKPEGDQFIVESGDREEDLANLFGADHGLDSYATKRRFRVQVSAFSNPAAYMRSYETLAT